MAQECMANEDKLELNVQSACKHMHTMNQSTPSESFVGLISHSLVCYIT